MAYNMRWKGLIESTTASSQANDIRFWKVMASIRENDSDLIKLSNNFSQYL